MGKTPGSGQKEETTKERLTGRELQQRLRGMDPDTLLRQAVRIIRDSIPVLSELPQEEKWSMPVALVLVSEELVRRYSSYVNLEHLAEELFETIQNHALKKIAKETPDKDKV